MPNDAKLGMVVGVGLVIVVAVVFFRKDAAAGSPAGPKAATPAPRTSGAHGSILNSRPAPPARQPSGRGNFPSGYAPWQGRANQIRNPKSEKDKLFFSDLGFGISDLKADRSLRPSPRGRKML